ncbi:MAG: hypothetical protein AAFV09_17800, partial [Pseudomonadota bacterium]
PGMASNHRVPCLSWNGLENNLIFFFNNRDSRSEVSSGGYSASEFIDGPKVAEIRGIESIDVRYPVALKEDRSTNIGDLVKTLFSRGDRAIAQMPPGGKSKSTCIVRIRPRTG